MKFPHLLIAAAVAAAPAVAADAPKDDKEKVSYSIGADLGSTFRKQGFELNPKMVEQGFHDAFGGAKLMMTEEEMQETMMKWQQEMQGKMEAKRTAEAAEGKKAGDAFLAENKKKEGVKTTSSGLQYKVIREGKGEKPKPSDTVVTNYRGTLIDGTEFDSSYKRGEPASFPVNAVIKGWTEALQMMPVGSKWQIYVPADLAYGDQGTGPIPPNSTLVFDVELLKIDKEAEGAQAGQQEESE